MWASSIGLHRVDSDTARLEKEAIAFDQDRFPRSFLLVNDREVWYGAYPGGNGNRSDTVARLDAATGEIEYFDDLGPIGGIDATMSDDAIWVLDYDGNVTRIDLR
jgi:hypothetical protein